MRSIISALCLLFFCIAFPLFYHWNPAVQRITVHILPLFVSFLFVLCCCGLGSPIAIRVARDQDKIMQALLAVAFGLGLTAVINLLTGLLAQFSFSFFVVWYLAGIILFVLAIRTWQPRPPMKPAATFWNVFSAGIFVLFLIPFVPFFVAPEVSTDALTYHLLLPKIYLTSRNLHFLPLFVEASYPNLAELNYIGILGLVGEIVCKTFHLWIGVLVLVLMYKIVRKVSPSISATLAPALFLSMPVVVVHLGWAWNDFIFTFFILLSLYFFLQLQSEEPAQTKRNFLLAGIMAGLASWTKYTFAIYFLSSLVLLLWGARKWKWQSRDFLFYFAGIALVAPFWLLQNWLFTRNPVYPFLNQIFRSPYWTEAANQYFIHHLRRYEIPDWNWTTYFLFPARIALNPRIIETHTGILPFAFIPLLLFRSQNKAAALLKAYLLFGIGIWLVIQTETRSMLSLFAVFFCIAAIQLQERVRWHALIATLISAAVILNFSVSTLTTEHLFSPTAHFLGLESKSQYIRRMVVGQQAYDYLNSNDKVKRVLLVSLHGPFYFQKSYFLNDYSDPPVAEVLTQNLNSAEEIARKLASLNISHVIIDPGKYKEENEVRLYSWNDQQRKRFETFIVKYCKLLARFPDGFVYEVNAPAE